jgi:acetyl-CoA C-acetyltransferase
MMMEDVFIVAARRTPIGRYLGAFKTLSAVDLGAIVVADLLSDLRGNAPDEVIMGQVLTAGAGQNPARQTALRAGLPDSVPAFTVNKVCGSGLKAIALAVQAIRCGDAEMIVAGGQESMSTTPHVLGGLRTGVKMGDVGARDAMIVDGLWDATHSVHMGLTAEHLADRFGISRREQDDYALTSQASARVAIARGLFEAEICAVPVRSRTATALVLQDEHPSDTTAEQLASLRPAFVANGTVTAGNASGLNDGAAAVVVMSGRRLRELNLEPMARIASFASTALEPMAMGLGPVSASRKALDKTSWGVNDLDIIEVNEAFAAQTIAVNREMGWNLDRVNRQGGAIALGHPIGASGARLVVTLVHAMRRDGRHRGLASLCIGGGMGVAMCLENTAH